MTARTLFSFWFRHFKIKSTFCRNRTDFDFSERQPCLTVKISGNLYRQNVVGVMMLLFNNHKGILNSSSFWIMQITICLMFWGLFEGKCNFASSHFLHEQVLVNHSSMSPFLVFLEILKTSYLACRVRLDYLWEVGGFVSMSWSFEVFVFTMHSHTALGSSLMCFL